MKKVLLVLLVLVPTLFIGLGIVAWHERDRLSAEALNRILSPYGIAVLQLRGVQLGRSRIQLKYIDWTMSDSTEIYNAKGLDAHFRLSPFFLTRLSVSELQVWIPQSAPQAESEAASLADFVQQWQNLPVAEVKIDALRIDSHDSVALRWQRSDSSDQLNLKYQHFAMAADIGRATAMSLDIRLRSRGEPVVTFSGNLDTAAGALHALQLNGDASLGELWNLSQSSAMLSGLLPQVATDAIAAAGGNLAFALQTALPDDPSLPPSRFAVQVLPGSNLAATLKNLPPDLSTSLAASANAELSADINTTLTQPTSLVWDATLQHLQAEAVAIKLQMSQRRGSADVLINALNCTSLESCTAEISLRADAEVLRADQLQAFKPQIHCSGSVKMTPALVDFTAGEACDLRAAQMLKDDIEVTAPEAQLMGGSGSYAPDNKRLKLKIAEMMLQATSVQQAEKRLRGALRLRDIRVTQVLGDSPSAPSFSSEFQTEKLKISIPDQWLPVLMVKGKITLAQGQANTVGELRNAADKPLLKFDLSQNVDKERGRGLVSINTENFDLGERKLSALLRGWPYPVDIVAGALTGELNLSWRMSKAGFTWQGAGNLAMNDIAGKANDIAVIGLAGNMTIRVDNGQLRSDGPATLRIDRVDVGLPVSEITVELTLDTAIQRYRINSLDARLLGGWVHAAVYDYSPGVVNTEPWEMRLNGILLERVLELAAFDSVTGQGRIDGMLPLRIEGSSATMKDGWLAGREAGVLRYVSATGKAVVASNPSLNLVTEALSNYHYETLRADANLNKAGDLKLAVVMRGANPSMRGGQRINLNLNVDNNIPSLLRTLRAGRIVDDMLEQQLKKRR